MEKVERIQTELDWINHNGGQAVHMIESAMERHKELEDELDWMCHRMAELQMQDEVHETVQAQMRQLNENAKPLTTSQEEILPQSFPELVPGSKTDPTPAVDTLSESLPMPAVSDTVDKGLV